MNRWIRLCAAVVAMMMIANLQYAWTLFVKPIIGATHWTLADVQWAFTIFIACETWLMPCSGWLIDRLGPRAFLTLAGVLCGAGWAAIGHASTLPELYAFYAIAGFGAALVYCGSMGIALKWFPDKRGLAAGLIAGAFGSGAALFIPFIAQILKTADYRTAFLYTGIAFGSLIILAAQFLQNPTRTAVIAAPSTRVRRADQDFTSWEMLQTPHFYLLFAMAVMMGIGGLMVTAQVAPMADSFKIGAAALALSVSLNPIANGAGRLFWGWISDHVGRERTMFVAFFLQSVFLVGVVTVGRQSSVLFIASVLLVFFTWGELYSLFPSACADFFGARNASSNYSFLYSAKGVASIAGGGLAAMLFQRTGSWDYGFYGCALMALITAFLALVLRKMPLPVKRQAAVPNLFDYIFLNGETMIVLGALIGAVLGFLFRPSVPLVGQLPFFAVITRGLSLTGLATIFKPTAEESFNYLIAGAVIGGIGGGVLRSFSQRSKNAQDIARPSPLADGTKPPPSTYCTKCGAALTGDAMFCGACSAQRVVAGSISSTSTGSSGPSH